MDEAGNPGFIVQGTTTVPVSRSTKKKYTRSQRNGKALASLRMLLCGGRVDLGDDDDDHTCSNRPAERMRPNESVNGGSDTAAYKRSSENVSFIIHCPIQ